MNNSNIFSFHSKIHRNPMPSAFLFNARVTLNLTQECLAKKLGYTLKTITDMEDGVMNLDKETELAVECLLRREGKWHTFFECA